MSAHPLVSATPAQLAASAPDYATALTRILALPNPRNITGYAALARRPDLTTDDLTDLAARWHNHLATQTRNTAHLWDNGLTWARALLSHPSMPHDPAQQVVTTLLSRADSSYALRSLVTSLDEPDRFVAPIVDAILRMSRLRADVVPELALTVDLISRPVLLDELHNRLSALLGDPARAYAMSDASNPDWGLLSWPHIAITDLLVDLSHLVHATPDIADNGSVYDHHMVLGEALARVAARPDLNPAGRDLIVTFIRQRLAAAAANPPFAEVLRLARLIDQTTTANNYLVNTHHDLFLAVWTDPTHRHLLAQVAPVCESLRQADADLIASALDQGAPLAIVGRHRDGTLNLPHGFAPRIVSRILTEEPDWAHGHHKALRGYLVQNHAHAGTPAWDALYDALIKNPDDFDDLAERREDSHLGIAVSIARQSRNSSYSDTTRALDVDAYIAWAANHTNPAIRAAVILAGLAWDPAHLTAAAVDLDPRVRAAVADTWWSGQDAALAPTAQILDQLMSDPDPVVRTAVASRDDATPSHLAAAVADPDPRPRRVAVHHPALAITHLATLRTDDVEDIAVAAAERFMAALAT